jgi:protein tyrosine phosphatase
LLEENIKTIRGLIETFRNEPREPTPEKDRIREVWDSLAEQSLVFVDTVEQFEALKAVVRVGNRVLKEQMNNKARAMGIEVPFEI